jgi:ElaB/YqjD/DUF883 family membrane-anchored ribosome-binding protein
MAERNVGGGQTADKEFESLRADINRLREDLATLTRHVRETAGEQVSAAGQRAREYADDARERASEAAAKGRARAARSAEAVESQIEDHPFTSITVAFGIGLLIGKLMSR